MAGHWCAGNCNTKISDGHVLCRSCERDLEKYFEENPGMVAAFAGEGIGRLEHMLASYAAFQRWLTEHEGGT